MKNGVLAGATAGLIAGIIGGIAVNIARIIEAMLGLPTAIPGMLTSETILYHLAYEIGQLGIFGTIFGIIYSKFYDAIPGKHVLKGLVFGVIIYLISNILPSTYWIFYGLEVPIWHNFAGQHIYAGFFCLIPFGLVLGAIFRK